METMNITSAQYTENNLSINATIDGITWVIPLDPANTTYAEIMHQVEVGELTIQEADS